VLQRASWPSQVLTQVLLPCLGMGSVLPHTSLPMPQGLRRALAQPRVVSTCTAAPTGQKKAYEHLGGPALGGRGRRRLVRLGGDAAVELLHLALVQAGQELGQRQRLARVQVRGAKHRLQLRARGRLSGQRRGAGAAGAALCSPASAQAAGKRTAGRLLCVGTGM